MPATEDERAGAVKAVEDAKACIHVPHQRQQRQQCSEHPQRRQPHGAGCCGGAGGGRRGVDRRQCDGGRDHARGDRADLGRGVRDEKHDEERRERDGRAEPVGDDACRHPHNRLRDDRDRRSLEPREPTRVRDVAEVRHPERERDHEDHAWQRETHPRGQHARIPGTLEPNCHADLARRGARHELAQGDEVGVLVVGEPLPLLHELVPEVPQMRRRPAERRQTEAGEYV